MAVIQYNRPDVPANDRLIVINSAGRCLSPRSMPLEAHLQWATARHLDVYGELPRAKVPGARPGPVLGVPYPPKHDWLVNEDDPTGSILSIDAQLVRKIVRCNRCEVCTTRMRLKWTTAAQGWFRSTELCLFGTLTFSNEYFAELWREHCERVRSATLGNLSGQHGFDAAEYSLESSFEDHSFRFDHTNEDHVYLVKQALKREQQKFVMRMDRRLERSPQFAGVSMPAHVFVDEDGELRGRPHMHFLMFFDGVGPGVSDALIAAIDADWHGRHDIGFTKVKIADGGTGENGCGYIFKYLVKYMGEGAAKTVTKARSTLRCSVGFRKRGLELYQDSLPSGEVAADENGDPFDVDRLVTDEFMRLDDTALPWRLKRIAREIAKAREDMNDGELTPHELLGLEIPADYDRILPTTEIDFAEWLRARFGRTDYRTESRALPD